MAAFSRKEHKGVVFWLVSGASLVVVCAEFFVLASVAFVRSRCAGSKSGGKIFVSTLAELDSMAGFSRNEHEGVGFWPVSGAAL